MFSESYKFNISLCPLITIFIIANWNPSRVPPVLLNWTVMSHKKLWEACDPLHPKVSNYWGARLIQAPLRKWGYRFGGPRVEEKGVSGAKLKWLHSEKKVGWHWSGMDFSWPDRGGAQLEIRGRGAWGSVLSWHCHDHDHDHQEFGVAGGEVPGLF